MEEKVIYEVKLSKSAMAIASVAALGLLLIGLKPALEVSPAFASNDVHKIAICSEWGDNCAQVHKGQISIFNFP